MNIKHKNRQDLGYLNEQFQYFRSHNGEMTHGLHNLGNYFNYVFFGLENQNYCTDQDHCSLFNL